MAGRDGAWAPAGPHESPPRRESPRAKHAPLRCTPECAPAGRANGPVTDKGSIRIPPSPQSARARAPPAPRPVARSESPVRLPPPGGTTELHSPHRKLAATPLRIRMMSPDLWYPMGQSRDQV